MGLSNVAYPLPTNNRAAPPCNLTSMETANMLLIAMFGFSGAVALLTGHQIRQRQAPEAISLPNLFLEKIKDRAGFSRFIGSRVMVVGLLGMLTAASIGLIPAVTQFILLAFTLGTATISLQAVLAHKRYL